MSNTTDIAILGADEEQLELLQKYLIEKYTVGLSQASPGFGGGQLQVWTGSFNYLEKEWLSIAVLMNPAVFDIIIAFQPNGEDWRVIRLENGGPKR